VPSRVCFDFATWHLFSAVIIPRRVAEPARMRDTRVDPIRGSLRSHALQ
jgi:hypothetical protein